MSLGDCITTALEHNLDIQIERYNPLIAEANRRVTLGDYDPQLSVQARRFDSRLPGGIDQQGRPFDGRELASDSLEMGVGGLAPGGIRYNIGASASRTDNLIPTLIGTNLVTVPFENNSADIVVGELRLPLLRNFWIDSTRLNLRLGAKSVRMADLNLRQRLITTVNFVETAYYDLVAARENVKSAEIGYSLAKKLYEENRKRVEVGALAQLDERQAQAQMAASEAAVIEARRAVAFTQNILKNLLADDWEKWHRVAVEPTDPLVALPVDLDVQEGWNNAFRLRPDLESFVVDLERRRLITRFTRNQLFPQLDFFGNVGWRGSVNTLNERLDDAIGQVVDGTAPWHSYGVQLTVPLSNRAARERHRVSQDERAQAELRLRQFRQQVMVGVSDSIQQAESDFQRVRATAEARVFAEEALSAEEKKLANGKSTSFEVLRLQRDLTQARLDETRALADYNKALATVRQRQGTTLLKFDLEAPPRSTSTSPGATVPVPATAPVVVEPAK